MRGSWRPLVAGICGQHPGSTLDGRMASAQLSCALFIPSPLTHGCAGAAGAQME
jgi:hypothetical protein